MHIYELHVDTDSGSFATHYFDIHVYPWMWFHPLLGLIIRMPHSCAACKCWCCQFRVASAAVQLSSLVDCSLTCPFVWFLYMFQPLLSHIIQFPFVWVASVVVFLFFCVCVCIVQLRCLFCQHYSSYCHPPFSFPISPHGSELALCFTMLQSLLSDTISVNCLFVLDLVHAVI